MIVLAILGSLTAAEFRQIDPISTPGRIRSLLHEGVVVDCGPPVCGELLRVRQVIPVNSQAVAAAAEFLADAWNDGGLEDSISERFYDKYRLLDTIREFVPPDAEITINAVRRINTIAQYLQWNNLSNSWSRISLVSARIDTELEFNDPELGFQSVEGTSDVLIFISELVVPP